MTNVHGSNVHAVAVKGISTIARTWSKPCSTTGLPRRVKLSGVNSINWARIMAQIVYYFTTAVCSRRARPEDLLHGADRQFRRYFAGYVAKRMGLPIDKLIIATNENDILARTLKNGRYEMRDVKATTSPSMDIQISSNFERLIFEANERDPRSPRSHGGLRQSARSRSATQR